MLDNYLVDVIIKIVTTKPVAEFSTCDFEGKVPNLFKKLQEFNSDDFYIEVISLDEDGVIFSLRQIVVETDEEFNTRIVKCKADKNSKK